MGWGVVGIPPSAPDWALLGPSVEGRRELGMVDGVEEWAGVQLLSASDDYPLPVLVVSVVDGLTPSGAEGVSLGFINPEAMAALLIEHGYCAPVGEGSGHA